MKSGVCWQVAAGFAVGLSLMRDVFTENEAPDSDDKNLNLILIWVLYVSVLPSVIVDVLHKNNKGETIIRRKVKTQQTICFLRNLNFSRSLLPSFVGKTHLGGRQLPTQTIVKCSDVTEMCWFGFIFNETNYYTSSLGSWYDFNSNISEICCCH